MRLICVIIVSCFLGAVFAFGAVEINNKRFVWYPERENVSRKMAVRQEAAMKLNPNAKAFVDETEHNFGILNRQQEGRHDFIVENQGTGDLVLQVNGTSCTCTGVDVNPKTVKPGGKSTITVHWNAENSQTTFTQSASLFTNDPSNPELVFRVSGLYTSPVVTTPGSLNFSALSFGREGNSSFRLFGLEQKPLEIQSIESSNDEFIETNIEPSEIDESEKEHSVYKNATNAIKVNVKIKPGLPPGAFQERLLIRTNYESEPIVEYFLKGIVRAGNVTIAGKDYIRDTGALNIGKTIIGKPLSSNFIVTFLGRVPENADLKIVKREPDFLEVDVQKIGGGSEESTSTVFRVSVKMPATKAGYWYGPEQKNMGLLEFETGVPQTPMLRFPIQFMVEGN